jgi:hypothetical protein
MAVQTVHRSIHDRVKHGRGVMFTWNSTLLGIAHVGAMACVGMIAACKYSVEQWCAGSSS